MEGGRLIGAGRLIEVGVKYERNRIFDPCRQIKNLSHFYRQALLRPKPDEKAYEPAKNAALITTHFLNM